MLSFLHVHEIRSPRVFAGVSLQAWIHLPHRRFWKEVAGCNAPWDPAAPVIWVVRAA